MRDVYNRLPFGLLLDVRNSVPSLNSQTMFISSYSGKILKIFSDTYIFEIFLKNKKLIEKANNNEKHYGASNKIKRNIYGRNFTSTMVSYFCRSLSKFYSTQ